MRPIIWQWDSMHLRSREGICEQAGISRSLAAKPARELKRWYKFDLALAVRAHTLGRMALCFKAKGTP